jgi:DNA-directed RNA polymerase subunit RPC12/RpoP
VVTGTDGKRETCSVMSFMESVKPMVLNATNSKTIAKLFKTPYIEEWSGRKIQLYVQTGVKAFGDVVDAIRVRPFLPVEKELRCADCGAKIEGNGKSTAEVIAKYTLSHYGRMLCNECGKKENEAIQKANEDKGAV